MPNRLDHLVLTVDANVIHQVDTTNSANLYSMWTGKSRLTCSSRSNRPADDRTTVFSRCAQTVEQGQRLENLSWRIWQKQQLVESTKAVSDPAAFTTTSPQIIPIDTRLPEVPQLSGSVESVADADETIELTSVSAPVEIVRPLIVRQDSSSSTRGSRRQTSPGYEKMMVSIVQNKAPLSAPHTIAPTMMHSQKRPMVPILEPSSFHRSGSTSTESQSPSKDSDSHSEESQPSPELPTKTTTTVVRGFSTSQASNSNVAIPSIFPVKNTMLPEPTASPAPKMVQPKKQPTFTLGASYSSSEQSRSLETRKPLQSAMAKKDARFTLGGSSEEEGSMKKSLLSAQAAGLTKQHKQTSFSNHVTMYHADEPDNAIESDSDDYIDESAIDDDDDSSDWEDSIEDSGKSSVDDKYFQRVDSNVNLTSRRSLITLMLAQSDDRARTLGGHASRSTSAIPQTRNIRQGPSLGGSPNDSDDAVIMMKAVRQPSQPLKPIKEIPRSSAQPITTPRPMDIQGGDSPRTTRRHMLSTELTESLRRHLLWERQQKSATANAVLKRRHTSHDVANLKQFPEKPCIKQGEDVNSSSWNQYFAKDTFDGYHSKGW